jgi:hypothetical protein
VRVRFVIEYFEVFETVVEDTVGTTPDRQSRQWERRARQLQVSLVEVVEIEMAVAAGPDEISDSETGLLCGHVGEERVRRDIERHTDENIGAALIQLAGQPAFRDVELEQAMRPRSTR